MRMELEILDDDPRLVGVVNVRVPGIYGRKGNALPRRMAKLVRPASEALKRAYEDIVSRGGHLYISDMFRSAADQQRAHHDWKAKRKTAYSPPACASVHEAGRAIDIDAFDTGVGHRCVRTILNSHGWTNIVSTLTGSECWHYEFRGRKWAQYRRTHGYEDMAHAMKEEIGNTVGQARAERAKEEVRWLQTSLRIILGIRLKVDGIYGEKTRSAVRRFQKRYRLQVDGVAGPITRRKIQDILDR